MRWAIAFFLVVSLFVLPCRAEPTLSSKLILRTVGSALVNTPTDTSSLSVGGLNLTGVYYFNSSLAVAIGYRADFDLANGTIPLQGLEIQGRYYYYGSGSRSLLYDESGVSRRSRDTWSAYFVSGFSQKSYLFSRRSVQTLEGKVGDISMGTGADYALNGSYELNAELTSTIVGFSTDPKKIKLRILSVAAGVGYLF